LARTPDTAFNAPDLERLGVAMQMTKKGKLRVAVPRGVEPLFSG
jgi:hypothetical protein